MTAFLQTAIPAVLTALIAGRIAWTRTSRLQRTINTNLDLLGRLPADHPNRAALEAHNGELLELLIRRQQRRFGPFTQAGVSFGALAGVAAVAFTFGCFSALLAAGVIPRPRASRPLVTCGPRRCSSWSWQPVSSWLRSGPPAGNSGSTHRRRSSQPRRALLPTEPACWSWLPMTSMELLARAWTRAPAWSAPVWDDLAALVEWHEGRCATCGRSEGLRGPCSFVLQYDHEHLPGEDRRAGRLRGLLCPSCNMREARYGGLLFDAYRRRPPAVILNIEVPYWTPEGGYAYRQPSVCWLRRGS